MRALLADAAIGPVAGLAVGRFQEETDAHGRLETREAWVVGDTHWLGKEVLEQWPGLAAGSLMMVRRTRQDLILSAVEGTDLTGRITVGEHCCISSLGGADDAAAWRLAGFARGHWAVENNLSLSAVEGYWQLDVGFDEDRRRVRKGHGAANFSRLCRIALNLLRRDQTVKAGIKTERLRAGWDHDYLLKLIGG